MYRQKHAKLKYCRHTRSSPSWFLAEPSHLVKFGDTASYRTIYRVAPTTESGPSAGRLRSSAGTERSVHDRVRRLVGQIPQTPKARQPRPCRHQPDVSLLSSSAKLSQLNVEQTNELVGRLGVEWRILRVVGWAVSRALKASQGLVGTMKMSGRMGVRGLMFAGRLRCIYVVASEHVCSECGRARGWRATPHQRRMGGSADGRAARPRGACGRSGGSWWVVGWLCVGGAHACAQACWRHLGASALTFRG